MALVRRLTTFIATTLASLSAVEAASDLPGMPSTPRPGPPSRFTVAMSNDALGGEIGNNPDDYRTTAFALTGRLGANWLGAVDYAALTRKADSTNAGHRSDELTFTLNRICWEHRDDTSYGLSLSYDYWRPFRSVTTNFEGESLQYLKPGSSLSLRFLVQLAW